MFQYVTYETLTIPYKMDNFMTSASHIQVPNIQLLLTGNELMSGDIVDSNSVMIAQQLKALGLEITRKVTVADNLAMLVAEINHLALSADILIINGGLGPTVDDMTAQALAQAMQLPLAQHPKALSHLKHWCDKRGALLNAPNLKQALLPKNCNIIANKLGSAVGFHAKHLNCDIYCTPGVPSELKTMMLEEIMPIIEQQIPNQLKSHITRLQVFGLGESTLQKMIDEQLPNWPKDIELGFRAGMPLLEVKLTTRTSDALKEKKHWQHQLANLLGDHLIAEIKQTPLTLAEHTLNLLRVKNLKLTTAESCTGGLIASMLTKVPGSSQNFEAGFVTYANHIKSKILSVPEQTLAQHGAVSKATVIAMAKGALQKSDADLAIAVSGIAGPSGGSKDKPVGMVWLAWGDNQQINTICLVIPFPRVFFQKYVATIALDLIRRHLIASLEIPSYIKEREFTAIKKIK